MENYFGKREVMASSTQIRPERFFSLFRSVSTLSGVGPKTLANLRNLGVTRVRDLLFVLPHAGVQRLKTSDLEGISLPAVITTEIRVKSYKQTKKGAPIRVLVDNLKLKLELVFFHTRLDRIKSILPNDSQRVISGKVEAFANGLQMVHPDYIVSIVDKNSIPEFEPIYPLTKGITQKFIIKLISQATKKSQFFFEWIDKSLIDKFQWPDFNTALLLAHNPKCYEDTQPQCVARERLAYDELLAHQISLGLARMHFRKPRGISIASSDKLTNLLRKDLSFSLTEAQEQSIQEIKDDLYSEFRMNRLLQGDVGSGKTIVSLMSMLTVVESGGQTALLAPTELLAKQHYQTISSLTRKIGINVVILTSKDKGLLRASKLDKIRTGKVQIIIGTHAIFQNAVTYKNLLFAVIDEQHRFGVQQRLALIKKGVSVDMLVMTATPIPRSLSLTFYGDMDISILNEKPKHRKPIITAIMPESKIESILNRLAVSLDKKQRVYWVCPLIDNSQYLQLGSAEKRKTALKERFPEKKIGMVHGQMSSDQKDIEMTKFLEGKIDILVATTVIEVGVDVPSASIMIVEGSERFGLAQLHQLRGRVGRGNDQSSCVFMYSGKLGKNSKSRLEILRNCQDGFKIAEEDLKIRGAGDVLGVKQSGMPKFLAVDLQTHSYLLDIARNEARQTLAVDPRLISSRGIAVRDLLYLMDLQHALVYIQAG